MDAAPEGTGKGQEAMGKRREGSGQLGREGVARAGAHGGAAKPSFTFELLVRLLVGRRAA